MIKKIIHILLCFFCSLTYAQRITRQYRNVSMADALRELNTLQKRYTVNFIYDDLEDFRVTTEVRGKSVPDALQQIIGFYPISVTQKGDVLLVECTHKAERHLTGKIIDEQGEAVAFANVLLLSPTDSTVIAGGVSNESGVFVVPYEPAKVLAKISYVGYKTFYRLFTTEQAGTIRLQPETQTLTAVKVKALRPQYKMTKGGMLVEVEHSLLSQLGTAQDVLGQLPRLTVSKGKVTVFARGEAEVYINNKKVQNDLDLSRLKSTDIKSVEIITSPGAEYNAEVMSVVRIKTIKKQGEGLSARNEASIELNHKNGGHNDLSLQYYKKGLELFSDVYFSNTWFAEDNHLKTTMHKDNNTLTVDQDLEDGSRSAFLSGQFGANYDINENHSVGATYTLEGSLFTKGYGYGTYQVEQNGTTQGMVDFDTRFNMKNGPGHEFNLYYMGKLGKVGIDLNGTYVRRRTQTFGSTMETSEQLDNRTANTHSTQRNSLWAGKLILSYPVGKAGNVSGGTEMTHTKAYGDYDIAEGYIDNSQNNINEHNIAGFAEWNLSVGKWSFNVGLRYEHVTSDFYSYGRYQSDLSRRYSQWFPSATISYDGSPWGVQLSYVSKTNRPYYAQLRNDMQYDNRYQYEGGNPSLISSIIHRIEASLTRRWLNVSAAYTYIKQPFMWTNYFYQDQTIAVTTYRNYPRKQTLDASIILSPKFGWYQPTLEADYSQQIFDTRKYGLDFTMNRPDIILKLRNRFVISSNCFVVLGAGFDSYGDDDFFRGQSNWQMGGSIHRAFFNKALILNIFANDIFRTQKVHHIRYSKNISTQKDCYMYNQCIGFTVTYNFNSTRSKYKGTGAGNEEKRRL